MNLVKICLAAFLFTNWAQAALVVTRLPATSSPLNGISDGAYQRQMRIYNTQMMDEWRVLNGFTNHVDDTWIRFGGQVIEVQPAGIRVQGAYYCPATREDFVGEFFVSGFPNDVAQGDTIGGLKVYTAADGGVYKYATVAGGSRTLHQLIYGTPCEAPQKSPEQIAAEAKLEKERRAKAEAAAIKFNQEQADKGDAYGQLRMAERYRDGDGVETNLLKAKFLFMMSANQGNDTAAKELVALTNAPAN